MFCVCKIRAVNDDAQQYADCTAQRLERKACLRALEREQLSKPAVAYRRDMGAAMKGLCDESGNLVRRDLTMQYMAFTRSTQNVSDTAVSHETTEITG